MDIVIDNDTSLEGLIAFKEEIDGAVHANMVFQQIVKEERGVSFKTSLRNLLVVDLKDEDCTDDPLAADYDEAASAGYWIGRMYSHATKRGFGYTFWNKVWAAAMMEIRG